MQRRDDLVRSAVLQKLSVIGEAAAVCRKRPGPLTLRFRGIRPGA
jgi:hypothetical protein